jgi:hypothetical protein
MVQIAIIDDHLTPAHPSTNWIVLKRGVATTQSCQRHTGRLSMGKTHLSIPPCTLLGEIEPGLLSALPFAKWTRFGAITEERLLFVHSLSTPLTEQNPPCSPQTQTAYALKSAPVEHWMDPSTWLYALLFSRRTSPVPPATVSSQTTDAATLRNHPSRHLVNVIPYQPRRTTTPLSILKCCRRIPGPDRNLDIPSDTLLFGSGFRIV